MAEWSKQKVAPSQINGGEQYTTKDNVSIEELNSIVENSLYASDRSDTAVTTSNEAKTIAQQAVDAVVEAEGSKVKINDTFQAIWNADFAEEERQKSKNLFYVPSKVKTATLNGVTITINDDGSILFNGTATTTIQFNLYDISQTSNRNENDKFISLDLNSKYTFSMTEVGGIKSDNAYIDITVRLTDPTTTIHYFSINTNSPTRTVTAYVEYFNSGYIQVNNGSTFDNYLIKVQLEKGNNKTDYVTRYGQIVHEKQIEETIERFDVIYDKATKNLLNGTAYSSGIQGGTEINELDFTKYKKIKVYFNTDVVLSCSEMFFNLHRGYKYYCSMQVRSETTDTTYYSSIFSINSSKTNFYLEKIGYVANGSYVDRNNNDGYYVYRIEGIY